MRLPDEIQSLMQSGIKVELPPPLEVNAPESIPLRLELPRDLRDLGTPNVPQIPSVPSQRPAGVTIPRPPATPTIPRPEIREPVRPDPRPDETPSPRGPRGKPVPAVTADAAGYLRAVSQNASKAADIIEAEFARDVQIGTTPISFTSATPLQA